MYVIHIAWRNTLFIVLSADNPDPMYQQMADQIQDAIAGGELPPGEKLPSIREMAVALDTNQAPATR